MKSLANNQLDPIRRFDKQFVTGDKRTYANNPNILLI